MQQKADEAVTTLSSQTLLLSSQSPKGFARPVISYKGNHILPYSALLLDSVLPGNSDDILDLASRGEEQADHPELGAAHDHLHHLPWRRDGCGLLWNPANSSDGTQIWNSVDLTQKLVAVIVGR